MQWLLWAVFIILEIGFAAYEMSSDTTKQRWSGRRLLVNASEILVYLILLFLPGIDFGFRFKGLAFLLGLRLVFAGVFRLIYRKPDGAGGKPKKRLWMVLGALGSILLLTGSMIPAFVFRDYTGRPVSGPYKTAEFSAILVDGNRTESFQKDGSFREVPIHIYYPEADPAAAGSETGGTPADHTLPLVLFSHGAFGYYQSNTSTYMELASHGYVVVSLDHPYHSIFTTNSKGKTVIADREFLMAAMNIGNSDASEAEVYEITSKWMELREADMNFVLDTLIRDVENGVPGGEWIVPEKESAKAAGILQLVDTGKIGLMGHSMGGATAVTVGRRDDVSAVIDFDGTMLGEETGVKDGVVQINDAPYDTPLLSFDSESHHADREKAEEVGYTYANNVILRNASHGFSTYFEGSAHMNFTDLPLFAPPLAKMLGTGSVDPEKCIDKINEITLAFFDCYLKGIGDFQVNEKY